MKHKDGCLFSICGVKDLGLGLGSQCGRPPLCYCSLHAPQKCLLQEAGSARWLLRSPQSLTKYGKEAHSDPPFLTTPSSNVMGKKHLLPLPCLPPTPSNTLLFRLSDSSCKKCLGLYGEEGRQHCLDFYDSDKDRAVTLIVGGKQGEGCS